MTQSTQVVLQGRGLKRAFGARQAVADISFELKAGEICAFLGPNGAGKTTLIKMLTGLLTPDGGEIHYQGEAYHPNRLALKKLIGLVPQHNNIDRELTPEENLRVHGLLYQMRGAELNQAIEDSLTFAGLEAHRTTPAEKLSGGMKRRLVIARALMHKPKILFLDEPTVGLDPHSRRTMWSFLGKINQQQGCTIFLTTHYLEEAERLASRVVFIEQGRVIADGSCQSLKQALGAYVVETGTTEPKQEFFDSRSLALARLAQIEEAAVIRETSLEDAFLQMTGTRLVNHG
ncbi:ABC transporter ATP-binding protein [Ferrimonas sp. SCSIO 43195]|uniref:ABC transporter ATP-binding protein n=1 Tax=Ferrimonas sp. SCSIO 43195 TaxID=2822844 RepID=UPI0020763E3F|nr:ABC transporter ATP-binding protein [Ferrimonas sp. SCSIO 43195]USD39400.1 ABC transporter ATP-binding protein [Ferrimonas sp. SCSIO 43195]